MANAIPDQIFTVYLADEETEDESAVGQVQLGEGGRLALLDSAPEQEKFLRSVIETINAKEELVEKAPPEEGDPRFTLRSRVIKRTDEDFFPALQGYLSRYYGLTLG